jgi:hypothetical protein
VLLSIWYFDELMNCSLTEQLGSIEQKLNSVNMLVNISKNDLIRTKKAIELEQESMILDHFVRRNVSNGQLILFSIISVFIFMLARVKPHA